MASTTVAEDTERYFGAAGVNADFGSESGDDEEVDVVVRAKNVQKTYLLGIEGVPALRGVSVSIKRGEFVIIFGTSGGGKTSLLNILGTIDKPTKGQVTIDGTTIEQNTTDKVLSGLRLNTIGFVFQTFNLLGSMTAIENVMMPMILQGRLTTSQQRARAEDLLTRVGMGDRLDHFPSMLSGGEQQRVTIARAIANEPSILLLDEPTGDLDTVNGAIVLKLLCDLNLNENITLIMVTHDVALKNLADRIIWVRDGKIARVEVNDEDAKAACRSELERVNSLLPTGDTSRVVTTVEYTNTDVRPPSYYPTLTCVESRAGRKEFTRRLAAGDVNDPDLPQLGNERGTAVPATAAGVGAGKQAAPMPTPAGVRLPPLNGDSANFSSEFSSSDMDAVAATHHNDLIVAQRERAIAEARGYESDDLSSTSSPAAVR